jgi:hypothetical protein
MLFRTRSRIRCSSIARAIMARARPWKCVPLTKEPAAEYNGTTMEAQEEPEDEHAPREAEEPPGADELARLAPAQQRKLMQARAKQAKLAADAACAPIKAYSKAGKKCRLYAKHRLLEELPPGWLLEQVDRHGKSAAPRTCDNYWLEPETERRFDSMRKVHAHLDPTSEAAGIIAARQADRLAWADTAAVVAPDAAQPAPKRHCALGADDSVEGVLEALVRQLERLNAPRPSGGRSLRKAPTSETMAERVEALVAEAPSAYMAFALANRGVVEAAAAELEPQELARRLTSLWRAQPAATRASYATLAAGLRSETSASLRCRAAERAQRLEEAHERLFALAPEDADVHAA